MAEVDAVPGVWRQRFMTSHPRNASPALFEAIRDLPSACEQLQLPVQSGDDALLRRMRRGYSVADYRAIIERARAHDARPAAHHGRHRRLPWRDRGRVRGHRAAAARGDRFDVVHLAGLLAAAGHGGGAPARRRPPGREEAAPQRPAGAPAGDRSRTQPRAPRDRGRGARRGGHRRRPALRTQPRQPGDPAAGGIGGRRRAGARGGGVGDRLAAGGRDGARRGRWRRHDPPRSRRAAARAAARDHGAAHHGEPRGRRR